MNIACAPAPVAKSPKSTVDQRDRVALVLELGHQIIQEATVTLNRLEVDLLPFPSSTVHSTPPAISDWRRHFDLAVVSDDDVSERSSSVKARLQQLGASLPNKANPYIDVASWPDPGLPSTSRGGYNMLFPEKLHAMLQSMATEGLEHVASFLPHGRAFQIDPKRLVKLALPRYFNGLANWSSFARQLSLYGFLRCESRDAVVYYHPLFLSGRQGLARYMRRVGLPKRGRDRRKCAGRNCERSDPDFYAYPPV